MSHVKTNQPSIESLNLVAEAYKVALANQVDRTKHAEQMVTELLTEKLSREEFLTGIVDKIVEHLSAKEMRKSNQYLGLIQTTLLALTNLQKTSPSPDLVAVIKALTLSVECSK